MENLDRNLIMLVESNQHLYNKELSEYKDKIRCQNTWKSIGARLKISPEDAQRRWKALRDRFGRVNHFQKNMPSGSSANQAGERSWPLFKSLEFLLPHVQHRKSIGNFSSSNEQRRIFDNSVSDNEPEVCDEIEYIDDEDVRQYLQKENETAECYTGTESKFYVENCGKENIHLTPDKSHGKNNPKKKTTMQADDRIIEMINDMEKANQAKSNILKKDVEWNFCISLYASLNKMDKRRRKNIRFRISQILHEAESSESN